MVRARRAPKKDRHGARAPPPTRHLFFSSVHADGACSSAQLVELKNGETYNGELVSCDNWMNIRRARLPHTHASTRAHTWVALAACGASSAPRATAIDSGDYPRSSSAATTSSTYGSRRRCTPRIPLRRRPRRRLHLAPYHAPSLLPPRVRSSIWCPRRIFPQRGGRGGAATAAGAAAARAAGAPTIADAGAGAGAATADVDVVWVAPSVGAFDTCRARSSGPTHGAAPGPRSGPRWGLGEWRARRRRAGSVWHAAVAHARPGARHRH